MWKPAIMRERNRWMWFPAIGLALALLVIAAVVVITFYCCIGE